MLMNNGLIDVSRLRAFARRTINRFKRQPQFFLKKVNGVIHVGGNLGQERDLYAAHDLNVLWIEPIPGVFSKLAEHIADNPRQRALCQLITDVDNKEYTFHISDNEGQSSSILDFAGHKEIWPEVSFVKNITLKSMTLSSLLKRERIDLSKYDALVIDTQGSELLVLKGAVDLLPRFRFIQTEAANFASYQHGCQLSDLDDFLRQHGFHRAAINRFTPRAAVGAYFDVTYAK